MGSPGPVLALDVGGTKLAAGVADSGGTLRSFVSTRTVVEAGPEAVIDRLTELGRRALAGAGAEQVAAIGIGCGGPLDPRTGLILGPPGLPGWDNVPLGSMISERFGVPAYVENDATAAALGEHRWGGWQVDNLVYLTLSTGLGGGIVADGKLFAGAAGQGGELGHIVVDWQGRECGCGARGCAEAYVSGTSIARRATEALAAAGAVEGAGGTGAVAIAGGADAVEIAGGAGAVEGAGGADAGEGAGGAGALARAGEVGWGGRSSLAALGSISAKDVVEHARAGDPLARMIWDETTAILGRMVAVIINVCEPELVILGGGVTGAGRLLLDPVREGALRQAMPPAAKACDVVLSRHGRAVGVLGAAAIAYHRLGQVT